MSAYYNIEITVKSNSFGALKLSDLKKKKIVHTQPTLGFYKRKENLKSFPPELYLARSSGSPSG